MTKSLMLLYGTLLALVPINATAASSTFFGLNNSCSPGEFNVTPGSANTETDAATVSFVPSSTTDFRLRYSTAQHGPWTTTATQTGAANTLEEFALTGLSAGTRYWYHVDCQPNAGGPWNAYPIGTFKTAYASSTVATFLDAVVADQHRIQSWTSSTAENCGTLEDSGSDNTDATYRAIASMRPDATIDLGDTYHGHCNNCATACTFNGASSGTGSATNATEAGTRLQRGLWVQRVLRRFSTFRFKQGNHDGLRFGTGSSVCNHTTSSASAALTAYAANMTNPNDAFPHGSGDPEDGLYWHERSGQVSRVFVDEYAYACTEGTSCTNGNLPDDPGDWTWGTNQKTWLSGLQASLGDVVIVYSHHPAASCPGGNNCYEYGRFGPLVTVDGQLGSDWNGPEEYLHDLMAAWVAAGKAVIRMYGHDHRFGYGGTREGVHYFVIGQPGKSGGATGWVLEDNYYGDCWDVDGDGSADYLDPDSPYFSPQPNDHDFGGFATIEYFSNDTNAVTLRWWGMASGDSSPRNTFTYHLDGASSVRLNP